MTPSALESRENGSETTDLYRVNFEVNNPNPFPM